MQPLSKLTNKARACIELELEHPNWTYQQLGDAVGATKLTVYNWHRSPVYTDELSKRLKEDWKIAAKKAQAKMIELMASEKQEVALNAAKYVLDSTGYKPTDKIDLDTNSVIKINIIEDADWTEPK